MTIEECESRLFSALVVDDDVDVGSELVEALNLIGADTLYFSSPVTCLEYLRSNNRCFDIVIADFAMPTFNGIEFLRLASLEIENSPSLFIMTGLAEFDGKPFEPDADVTLLPKPFTVFQLKEKVGHSLRA